MGGSMIKFVSTIFLLFMFVAYIASFVCVTIHIYKFIRSKPPQSFTIKNLTFYCFILFLYYVNYLILMICNAVNEKKSGGTLTKIFDAIKGDLTVITMCLKLIMAIDICLCFRKIALYLQSSSLYDTKKFIIYCLTGALAPSLLIFTVKIFFKDSETYILVWTEFAIPLIRLIPISGAIWYIRKNTVDRTELWKNFSLQMRLFIMIGGFSSAIDFVQMIFIIITRVWGVSSIGGIDIYDVTIPIMQYGIFMEGLAIAIAFTFRADTLKPIQGRKFSCTPTETITVAVKC